MSTKKPKPTGLEPFCSHLRGNPPRCQAKAKGTGEQCNKAAVRGSTVCTNHGAGTRKRVKEGKRQDPVTASIKHRLYSGIKYDNHYTLVDRIETALEKAHVTDRELAVAKSVLETTLNSFADQPDALDRFHRLVQALEDEVGRCIEAKEIVEAKRVRQDLRALAEVVTFLDKGLERLLSYSSQIILMEKARAEIKAKLSETRSIDQFAQYISKARSIFWEIATQEQLDLLEERLRREVLNPMRLELPDPKKPN